MSIKDACDMLDAAQTSYDDAHKVCEDRRRDEATALNTLNNAQKEFDKSVKEYKKLSTPWGSSWDTENRAVPIENIVGGK